VTIGLQVRYYVGQHMMVNATTLLSHNYYQQLLNSIQWRLGLIDIDRTSSIGLPVCLGMNARVKTYALIAPVCAHVVFITIGL